MKITDAERAQLEQALDALYVAMKAPADHPCTRLAQQRRAAQEYVRAVSIVRDRPAGHTKVRSDFNRQRPTPQQEIQNV